MFRIYSGQDLIYEPGDSSLAVVHPKLTLEMGKAGSLEFITIPGHPWNEQILRISTPVQVTDDNEEIFRGRVLSGKRTFYNQREVYCEGDLSYLIDSVQKAEKYTGTTHALFAKIIQAHNARMPASKQFTVGNVTVENRSIILTGQEEVNTGTIDYKQIAINSIVDEWNTTYDYIENCLISYEGGYLMTRRVGNITYIDWLEDYSSTSTQEIEFGENMLDLNDEINAEDLFTVLIPLGDDNLTIKTVNNNSDELVNSAAVEQYGRIVKTHVFNNVTSPSTLKENGQRYLATNGVTTSIMTITAVDMHAIHPEIRAIHLGDRVRIVSEPHGLNQYLTCTKIEYDLENPGNTVYTFGREKQSLTERYREDKRKQNDTYGNSADGSYGIGAASVGALAATAGEVKRSTKNEMYEEWIDVDPDNPDGVVSLGAMYSYYKQDRQKIENRVGIDFDATDGSSSLYSIVQTGDSTNSTAIAAVKTWAGYDPNGDIMTRITLDAAWTNVTGRLSAVEGIFSSITAERVTVNRGVSAGTFYGNNFIVSSNYDSEVNLATHYHNIVVDNTGKLYLTGPTASRTPTDIGAVATPVFGS